MATCAQAGTSAPMPTKQTHSNLAGFHCPAPRFSFVLLVLCSYEAWIIYNFSALLLAYVGGPGAVVVKAEGKVVHPSWFHLTCCLPAMQVSSAHGPAQHAASAHSHAWPDSAPVAANSGGHTRCKQRG